MALPTAKVWVADALDATPFLETEAKLERIGLPGGDTADAHTTSTLRPPRLPRAGTFWFLAEPEGGAEKRPGTGNVVVVKDDAPGRRRS